MGSIEDFEQVAEDRYDNYGSLSRLFRIEVDKELLADLCDSPVAEEIGNEKFDGGYADIRAFLDGIEDIDKGKSALAIDYNLVFIGYGVNPKGDEAESESAMNAAYPYESVYATGRKTLTGGDSEGITSLYHEQGFHPTRYRIAADDHMACELEFLHFLVGQEILSARENDMQHVEELRNLELSFIEEHPLKWIGLFTSEIEKHGETGFYSALARMTAGWLEFDRAFLSAELSEGEEA